MKGIKYLFYALGGIMVLSNMGGMFMGRYIPLLWIAMIIFFGIAISIKDKKEG